MWLIGSFLMFIADVQYILNPVLDLSVQSKIENPLLLNLLARINLL